MSKLWKPNPFRYLESPHSAFLKDQEKKLDADHNWTPVKDADPPIGGEYAIADEEYLLKKTTS